MSASVIGSFACGGTDGSSRGCGVQSGAVIARLALCVCELLVAEVGKVGSYRGGVARDSWHFPGFQRLYPALWGSDRGSVFLSGPYR